MESREYHISLLLCILIGLIIVITVAPFGTKHELISTKIYCCIVSGTLVTWKTSIQ